MARTDVPRGTMWIIGIVVILSIVVFSGQRGPEDATLYNICTDDGYGRTSAGQSLIPPSETAAWSPATVFEDGSGLCTPDGDPFPADTFKWECREMGNRLCGKGE